MSRVGPISPFVATIDQSDDHNLNDGLQEICFCCREKKRQMEDTNETNDLTSMLFDGEFAESVNGLVDMLSLTH